MILNDLYWDGWFSPELPNNEKKFLKGPRFELGIPDDITLLEGLAQGHTPGNLVQAFGSMDRVSEALTRMDIIGLIQRGRITEKGLAVLHFVMPNLEAQPEVYEQTHGGVLILVPEEGKLVLE